MKETVADMTPDGSTEGRSRTGKRTAVAMVRFDKEPLRLEMLADTGMYRTVCEDGFWERHISVFLSRLMANRRRCVFFDVGANVGYYTVIAGKLGAEVVAFEPNPEVREILARNVKSNSCEGIVIDDRIVANAGARLRMIAPEGFEEGGFAAEASMETAGRCTTLDAYCEQTERSPSIIKIDVEGRDLDVLAGALNTLRRANPAVVFEFQPAMVDALDATKPADIFPALEDIGYRPYLFRGHSVLAVERVDYDILSRIYDLNVGLQSKGSWDVLLWPPRARDLVKPFDTSRPNMR